MVYSRPVAPATLGLAWRGAVPLVGIAIVLGAYSDRAPVSPGHREPVPGADLSRDEDGTPCLTLAVPEGDTRIRCVVRDQDGKELMCLSSYRNGAIEYNLAESGPVRVTGYRRSDGAFGLGVGGDGLLFDYTGGPGRPPSVCLYSQEAPRQTSYRLTPEGSWRLDPVETSE